MKIIIAGAGAVGTHLSRLLSKEKQDIVLIDEDHDKLGKMESYLDIMTVNVSPTSITGLKNAGVGNTDLFVAVTPDESRNMTACIIANSLGAKKTIARIENYEYLLPKNAQFFKNIGINSMICPEMLAAKEIVSSLKMSWIRQWWEFGGGALVMLGSKMRESSTIVGKKLMELGRDIPYHIVAIKRGNETIIPRGTDEICLNDIVYATTQREHLEELQHTFGKDSFGKITDMTIMGGSRIAVKAAQYAPDNVNVKIIEADYDRCLWLTEHVGDRVMVINGDGRDIELLKEEGITKQHAFVALTDNSETNILACLSARQLGFKKTIAEVENVDYISMAESLDIGVVINKKQIAASHIYQMMLDADVSNVKTLSFANADVAEFTVKEKSYVTRHKVKDIGFPKGFTIGGVIRDGHGMIVNGNSEIMANDHVVVFCGGMIKKIENYFN